LIVGIGDFVDALRRVAPDDPRIIAVDAQLVEAELLQRLPPTAAILLKGSRGARLERLVAPITAWATSAT